MNNDSTSSSETEIPYNSNLIYVSTTDSDEYDYIDTLPVYNLPLTIDDYIDMLGWRIRYNNDTLTEKELQRIEYLRPILAKSNEQFFERMNRLKNP